MKRILILGIRCYRRYISPFKRPCCIFYPTCSQYTLEAIEKHGAIKGSIMGIKRIFRCHPYNKGGFDPIK